MGSGPNGCFTPRTYQHVNLGVAGIVLYPIALLWSFVGTQYIADEYFSVALDGIVELYHIDPDVAGATILAVGTSFPELICGFASHIRFVRHPVGDERLGRDAPARLGLPRDLRRVRRIRHPGRDPGHRAGAGVALSGLLPPPHVPAAALVTIPRLLFRLELQA